MKLNSNNSLKQSLSTFKPIYEKQANRRALEVSQQSLITGAVFDNISTIPYSLTAHIMYNNCRSCIQHLYDKSIPGIFTLAVRQRNKYFSYLASLSLKKRNLRVS